MRYLSLFSGIEAASVAWLPLGWECVGVSEIAPFPCRLLKHHYPDVPNLGSVSDITAEQIRALGPIDLVVGGFPCQDLSVAGKQRGLENDDGSSTRSGLFFDAMRVVRWADPRWVVIENVPGMFSSSGGDDFRRVVSEMAGAEYGIPRGGWQKAGAAAGPNGLVEWRTLDAQWGGVPQRRRRVFLVRDSGDWLNRQPVLLEPESLCRNPPSREQARQEHSRAVAGGARERGVADVTGTLLSGRRRCVVPCGSSSNEAGSGMLVPEVAGTTVSVGAVCASAYGAGERGIPDICGTIISGERGLGPAGARDAATTGMLLPVMAATITKGYGDKSISSDGEEGQLIPDVAPTLTALSGGADCASAYQESGMIIPETANPLTQMTGVVDEEPYTLIERSRDGIPTLESRNDGTANAVLTAGGGRGGLGVGAVGYGLVVRRLTPTECERLQGFPDGWTNPPEWTKPAADTPRYSALGNSMAVPVMRAIGERIALACEEAP